MFQFIAKEELEKNERTQMKQLTLEISERQEEEELQVKEHLRFGLLLQCGIYACKHSHQHRVSLLIALFVDFIFLLTQEAIQQLQRVSVGGQRDQHRGARGFRPPKVFNETLFIGLIQNMNAFQGAPDADLIFGSGKRAPPK